MLSWRRCKILMILMWHDDQWKLCACCDHHHGKA
jgi:hypothetical protein